MSICIFCKIARKETPSTIVFEDEEMLAFNDIHPIAPVHILIIPKKHIPGIESLRTEDKGLIEKMFSAAQKIAREKDLSKSGYRLIFNIGEDAGQTVDHLHLHLLGGKKLPWR